MPNYLFYDGELGDRPGYVYVLRSSIGPSKIGIAQDTNRRVKLLGVLMPFDTELVVSIFTQDMRILESLLHERFSAKHIRGEWFNLDDDDIAYIADVALGTGTITDQLIANWTQSFKFGD